MEEHRFFSNATPQFEKLKTSPRNLMFGEKLNCFRMKNLTAEAHNERNREEEGGKKNSDGFGLRRPVIQKLVEERRDTSIVACVFYSTP